MNQTGQTNKIRRILFLFAIVGFEANLERQLQNAPTHETPTFLGVSARRPECEWDSPSLFQSFTVSLGSKALNPPSRSPHEGGSASLLRWELSAVSKPLRQKRHLKLSFKKRCKKKTKMFGEDNR